ncbi:hypothetical protein D3C81_1609830 [compost metagenome]
MGPGREPEVCENDELVSEFEIACRAGDYEFAEEYKKEIIRRLEANEHEMPTIVFGGRLPKNPRIEEGDNQ